MAQYKQDLHILRTLLKTHGYDDATIQKVEGGCLNDPRVCLYNLVKKNNVKAGDMDMELKRIGKELNSGLTTMSGTVNDSTENRIEQEFEDMMGQFSETACEDCGNQSWTTLGMTEEEIEEGERHGNSKIYDKCWKGYSKVPGKKAGEPGSCKKNEGNAYAHAVKKAKMKGKKKGDEIDGPDGEKIKLEKDEQKIPLGEFILSYFDYTTGQFPKGETAVLTMVEKDYGEQYIEPAKQFLEKINNRVSEVMGYREEEPVVQDNTELDSIRSLAGI